MSVFFDAFLESENLESHGKVIDPSRAPESSWGQVFVAWPWQCQERMLVQRTEHLLSIPWLTCRSSYFQKSPNMNL